VDRQLRSVSQVVVSSLPLDASFDKECRLWIATQERIEIFEMNNEEFLFKPPSDARLVEYTNSKSLDGDAKVRAHVLENVGYVTMRKKENVDLKRKKTKD